jgi:hypothetical protein
MLEGAGWIVVRVWEHEAPEVGADMLERALRLREETRQAALQESRR